MTFLRKHPYIAWQLIGWGIVLVDMLYMVFCPDNHCNIPVVALTLIGGAMVIVISPPVIFYYRRDKKQKYHNQLIMWWYTQKYGRTSELIITFFSVLVFIISAGVILRSGYFFLIPFAVYAAALPYLLWRQYVIRKFYRVPHAKQYCKVISMRDTVLHNQLLNQLLASPTLMYTVAADEIFFNFIYNYYHNMGLLKKQEICFYQIEYSLLNAKYGFKFENAKSSVLCISSEDIVIDERTIQCYADATYLFDRYIGSYQHILNMEHTDMIKGAIRSRIFSVEDLRNVFWRLTGSEAETEELVAEVRSIRSFSFELDDKIWNKLISREEAGKILLQKYAYLSTDEVDIILEETKYKGFMLEKAIDEGAK